MKTVVATLGLLVAVWACLACGQAESGQSTQDRFFDSNGVRIRYQVWGKGAPVILIHGFGESLESWHRGGVVRALSPHFQVIALDLRGHGGSGKPHDQKSYGAELSEDIVRLLRHLGTTKAHIVGYSMGALVALDFAVLHQEHALSIVLGGAGLNPPETLDDFRQQAEAFEQGKVPGRAGDDVKALAAMLRALRVLSEEDVRRIRVPMAALIGADDRFMANVQRLSRVLPGMQVTVIPGVDHASAPGHPKFGEELLAFLLKQKGATLPATQGVAYQGKPVPLIQLGPKRSGPRTSFSSSKIQDPFRLVVRDRDTWLGVWKRVYQVVPSNGPYPELPEIDFSREMLIVAAMGQQPTSGYEIIIDSAYERDGRLEVVVKSIVNKCGGVFMMVTSPIDIVRLPKIERPVVFREIKVVPDCNFERAKYTGTAAEQFVGPAAETSVG